LDTQASEPGEEVVIDDEERYRNGLVPLSIGVTGHRDLVPDELPAIRGRVTRFLLDLQEQFPDRPLRVLSPLAEGADQLVAEVALELGLTLMVPMPMKRELYSIDFKTDEQRARFAKLYKQASEVFELPAIDKATDEALSKHGPARDKQYAQLGVFLCAHSHILLALWDGKASEQLGGTAQVVHFHHYDVMAGYSPEVVNQQILADDDSDLVFQIVVSRNRQDGRPRSDLKPLSAFYLTTDTTNPITADLPDLYRRIFARTSEFNRDVKEHAEDILNGSYPLIDDKSELRLPRSVHRINRFFCAADYLAIVYQKRLVRALKWSHSFVYLMGSMFLLYSDVATRRLYMALFAIFLVGALGANRVAAKGKWHSKYLEYRALAEGLRVQFYWAAAGVTSGSVTKYAHDNFLQKQDIELGWIRNVMRVAGIGCDVVPFRNRESLKYVLDEWIGDETRGQLRYYKTKATQYIATSRRLAFLGRSIGFCVAIFVVIAVFTPSDGLRSTLFVVIGMLLLTISVREAYAYRIAEKEVIKQYEFMYRIFSNAKLRIDAAKSNGERRRVLRILGESALDEHAEWILLHRERPLDQDNLWRMEA